MRKVKPKARPKKPSAQLRLERGEGDARVFWEIAQFDTAVATNAGRYLYAGRAGEKVYADRAAADAAFASAIAKKRAEGYSEPTPKNVIGASSRKGVVARNPDLEAFIDEDPSDLSRYLVYADWLQQEGDPRGELIIAQHNLAMKLAEIGEGANDDTDLEALEHVEWKLFHDFKHELLGRTARYAVSPGSVRAFAWRCGFARAARVYSMDALAALLDHSTGRFLEHLVVDEELVPAASALLQQKAPKTFTSLGIASGYLGEGTDLARLMPLFPRLRRLSITGRATSSGENEATIDHLEELDVGCADPETVRALSKVSWPSLERLHLTLAGFDGLPTSTMTELLSQLVRQIPAAKHVTCRRWIGASQVPLAEAILTAFKSVESKVTRLDLEMVLADDLERLIAVACDLPRGLRLQIPTRAITGAMLRAQFREKVKTLTFVADLPVERILDDVTPFHHA